MSDTDVGIIKQEILSLLVSAKYGLSEKELLNDYRMFNSNKDIPYRELGYSSLIALLRTWPDVCRLQQQGNNGTMTILAVEEENTKHILSMVKGQRSGKVRRGARGGFNRGRGGGRGVYRGQRGGRFLDGASNFNSNRSRGNGRGVPNGRLAYNNNRSENFNAPARAAMGQQNQHFRYRGNGSAPPRYTKPPPPPPQQQQQQTRTYVPGSSQSSVPAFDSRASVNVQSADHRQVTGTTASMRITVANNANENSNDYPQSPDIQYASSENEVNDDGDQYNGEDDPDREEEVRNNLRTLLAEHPHGIRLLRLDRLYEDQFGKSLLSELKIANILLLQDFVDDFAGISRHGEENGSCDHIITLKDPSQVAQTQAHLLQQITDSGTVPRTFRYANNLFSFINDSRFRGFISDIDKTEHCLHVQPVRYQEHIETLMEELDSYYCSPTSNALIIRNVETGLSCVTKYDGAYHRVFIKESDLYKCVIVYVDYGTTEEINKDEQQFRYLLNHFAELPCMAIACRLDDLYFLPDDTQWSSDTYNEVYALCKDGPYFIEPTGYLNGLLTIRILDAHNTCLNDILVELKLAVKISQRSADAVVRAPGPEHTNVPKPVQLTFDMLDHATHCPLPSSEPSTPESSSTHSGFQFPVTASSNVEHRCKLVQIDENDCLYLIRFTDGRPYLPCFSLAQLLRLSESDILSETLLSRTRLPITDEYRPVVDFLRQGNPSHCLHIHQNFLFLFDLISTMKFIEQQHPANAEMLIEALREQVKLASQEQYWKNNYERYKPSISSAATSTTQPPNQNDIKRYNELLVRRNNLCNMLRVDDLTNCTLELESIENELQTLIEKMRWGTPVQQNGNYSSPPSRFPTPSQTGQQPAAINKTSKLKDLMERCKKLINVILTLNDYIDIDDSVTRYIQENLAFLSSKKSSSQDEQLYKHYSDFFDNLTHIVNDLQRKLPFPIQS